MKKILFLMVLLIFVQKFIADAQQEGKTGNTISNKLFLQISSLPEAKIGFNKRLTFPFLQGENFLTEDSNIRLDTTAEISPISINGIAETVWTPIAFLQFAAGGRIGSGWKSNIFESEIYGIGVNKQNAEGKPEHDGEAFDGLLWKVQTGAALQMDLAAIYPGEWHHLLLRSYHEINYKGYTRAAANESWYYENDDGENCNGFNYYGNLFVGYQMPFFFDLAALLAEADQYLYYTPDRHKWGDDIIRWTFSCIFNFSINKHIDLTLITQFRTQKNYQESNWQDLYYRNRNIDDSKPLHLEFYRIVTSLTYKL